MDFASRSYHPPGLENQEFYLPHYYHHPSPHHHPAAHPAASYAHHAAAAPPPPPPPGHQQVAAAAAAYQYHAQVVAAAAAASAAVSAQHQQHAGNGGVSAVARQPTPTELYDSGMERTLDGGRMDPRNCTPPHLSYNRQHALADRVAKHSRSQEKGSSQNDEDDDVVSVISEGPGCDIDGNRINDGINSSKEKENKVTDTLNKAKNRLQALVDENGSPVKAAQDTLRDDPDRLAKLDQTCAWAKEVTRQWQEGGTRLTTTVMIRNIPNRYSVSEVLEEIDARGFYKTYNYFYLPCDFGNKVSLGYAFLNFVSAQYVEQFVRDFSGTVLPRYCTNKVIDVVAAGKQGLNENVARFLRRDLKSRVQNPFFLPLIFGWSSRREWVAYPLSRPNLYKIETRAKEVSALASTEAKLKAIDEAQQREQQDKNSVGGGSTGCTNGEESSSLGSSGLGTGSNGEGTATTTSQDASDNIMSGDSGDSVKDDDICEPEDAADAGAGGGGF